MTRARPGSGPKQTELLPGRQELDERVDLGARQLLGEVGRHHALLEAGFEVGIRADDRLARERSERLPGALRLGWELVEVRPDGSLRPGWAERMAAGAPRRHEDVLARRRGDLPAPRRRGRGIPGDRRDVRTDRLG